MHVTMRGPRLVLPGVLFGRVAVAPLMCEPALAASLALAEPYKPARPALTMWRARSPPISGPLAPAPTGLCPVAAGAALVPAGLVPVRAAATTDSLTQQ